MASQSVLFLLDGTKVRALRRKPKRTQAGFAAFCGISPRELGEVEGEKRCISQKIATRIAKAGGTTVESLVKRKEYPDKPVVDLPGVGGYRRQLDKASAFDM